MPGRWAGVGGPTGLLSATCNAEDRSVIGKGGADKARRETRCPAARLTIKKSLTERGLVGRAFKFPAY
jgi:hypothetical protein